MDSLRKFLRFFTKRRGGNERRWDLVIRSAGVAALLGIPTIIIYPRSIPLVWLAVLSIPANSPLSPIIPAAFEPLIYVVEGRMLDIMQARPCACFFRQRGVPNIKCEFCHGKGFVGYDYSARKITPQFVFHRVFQMQYEFGVQMLFADNRVGGVRD